MTRAESINLFCHHFGATYLMMCVQLLEHSDYKTPTPYFILCPVAVYRKSQNHPYQDGMVLHFTFQK